MLMLGYYNVDSLSRTSSVFCKLLPAFLSNRRLSFSALSPLNFMPYVYSTQISGTPKTTLIPASMVNAHPGPNLEMMGSITAVPAAPNRQR